jgi:PAS domain S-box-containing protein
MKDRDGRYLSINCAAANSLGLAAEEIIGKDDYAIFPRDVAERFQREDAETIASGGPCKYESEVSIEGQLRYLQTVKSLCRDLNGEVIGIVGISRDVTDRRALDVALLQRERDLTEAHRIAKLGTWSWSLKSGEVKWSEEVFRTFGQDPELGTPTYAKLLAMHTPESRMRLETAVNLALAHGTPYEVDLEISLPDGSTRWVLARGEVDEWQEGQVAGLRGTIQNISERKRTEYERLEALQRLEALMNALPVGVSFSDDATSKRVTANPAALAQFEVRPGGNLSASATEPEAPGRQFSFFHNNQPITADQLPLQRAVAENREIPCMELEVQLPSGRRWMAEAYGAPVRDVNGQVVGGVTVTVDVTERKQVEAALREREQRFRALAESLPQLVWIRDAEGGYVYANQRLHDFLGISAGSLQTSAFEFIHPEDVGKTNAGWKRSMETGEDYVNEYRLRRHDGEYRHFLARAVPVRDETGRILQWLGTSTDVNDQKLAEDALRRTEKLNTAARFAASMAHEINNPLNSVMNSVYLALRDNDLNIATRELLAVADRELARTTHVVRQTLRFHRQSTAQSFVDLSELMDSVLALYKLHIKPNFAHIETEYLSHQRLLCFSDELRHVFGNLVSNSLDSMKSGGRLRVRVAPGRSWHRSETRGIRVTVADSGAGIPVELRKRVFEPFVSSKESFGTGLGLWVSEDIVKKHKGTIAFRSSTEAERHGTVFSVFLPLTNQP